MDPVTQALIQRARNRVQAPSQPEEAPDPMAGMGFDADMTPGAADRGATVASAAFDMTGVPMIAHGGANALEGIRSGDYTKAGLGAGEAALGAVGAIPFAGPAARIIGAGGKMAAEAMEPIARAAYGSLPRMGATAASTVAVPSLADAADGTERQSKMSQLADLVMSGAKSLGQIPSEIGKAFKGDDQFKKQPYEDYRKDHQLTPRLSEADARSKATEDAIAQAEKLFPAATEMGSKGQMSTYVPKSIQAKRDAYVKNSGDTAAADARGAPQVDPMTDYNRYTANMDAMKSAEDQKPFFERYPGVGTATKIASVAAPVIVGYKGGKAISSGINDAIANATSARATGDISGEALALTQLKAAKDHAVGDMAGTLAKAAAIPPGLRLMGDGIDQGFGPRRNPNDPNAPKLAGDIAGEKFTPEGLPSYLASQIPGAAEGLEGAFGMGAGLLAKKPNTAGMRGNLAYLHGIEEKSPDEITLALAKRRAAALQANADARPALANDLNSQEAFGTQRQQLAGEQKRQLSARQTAGKADALTQSVATREGASSVQGEALKGDPIQELHTIQDQHQLPPPEPVKNSSDTLQIPDLRGETKMLPENNQAPFIAPGSNFPEPTRIDDAASNNKLFNRVFEDNNGAPREMGKGLYAEPQKAPPEPPTPPDKPSNTPTPKTSLDDIWANRYSDNARDIVQDHLDGGGSLQKGLRKDKGGLSIEELNNQIAGRSGGQSQGKQHVGPRFDDLREELKRQGRDPSSINGPQFSDARANFPPEFSKMFSAAPVAGAAAYGMGSDDPQSQPMTPQRMALIRAVLQANGPQ